MEILSVQNNVITQVTPTIQSQGTPSAGQIVALGAGGQLDPSVIPGGSAGGSSTYVFDQTTPDTVWDIVHALNRYPDVTVVDSAGNLIIGSVKYISSNEIVVSFSTATLGQAFLN